MRKQQWDALEHRLAELLLVDKVPVRQAVPLTCRAFSDAPATVLVLSLVSAASVFDSGNLARGDTNRFLALELYRAASMVAADLAVFGITGKSAPDCGGLLRYWQQSEDAFFKT